MCLGLPTYQDLVQKVLDELLLQRSRSQQSVEVSAQELGDEVTGDESVSSLTDCGIVAYMSSSGEMKMSLREMT